MEIAERLHGTIAASRSLTRKETTDIILETDEKVNPAIRAKPAKSLPSVNTIGKVCWSLMSPHIYQLW
jgi:hypothetical protein